MQSWRKLYGIFALALFAMGGFAQDRTASMTGTVRDPSGAAVPEAKITIRNTGTGIKRVANTSANGDYTATLLDPGTYDVLVEHAGFKSIERPGIVLHVNDDV